MRLARLFFAGIFLVGFCFSLSIPAFAPADEFLWTGNAGNDLWNDEGNWQNESVVMENVTGIPAFNDNVRFSSDASVVASVADRFGGFTVDENTSLNLQSVGFDRLIFSNSPTTEIQNAGEFSLNADAGQDRASQLGLTVRAIDLTGGGTTTFSNVDIRPLVFGQDSLAITNRDNTLRASGSIGLPIYNNSLIRVDLGQLAANIRNRGVVEVDTGSELIADIENTAEGLVQVAPNGIISGSVRGGSLHGDGAIIHSPLGFASRGISLTDVDLSGSFTATESLFLSGAINNDATIAADRLEVGSLVNLNGSGELVFDGGRIRGFDFSGAGPLVTLVNGDGHTIRGSAEVTSDSGIVQIFNRGLIRAEGESGFTIPEPSFGQPDLPEIDNRDGRIEIASGSFFSGGAVGGSIVGEAGSSFNGKARDVTLLGDLPFGEGAELGGTINNVGTLNLIARRDDVGREVGGFSFSDDVSFEGGGELVLQGGTTPLITAIADGSNFLFLPSLNNIDNTIRGHGVIESTVFNSGVIRAEHGRLEVDMGVYGNGDIQIAADGIFEGSVRGNSIHGETGAVLSSDRVAGQYEDVSFSGDFELTGDRGRQFAGQIENSGTLTAVGSGGRFGGIGVVGEVTLTGGGALRLTGDAPALFEGFSQSVPDAQPQLINVDNTVSGHGSIDVFFNNQSVVRAEGGTLTLGSRFENYLGTVEIGHDGTLDGSLEGGTVVGELGSQVTAAITNATLEGFNTVSEGGRLTLLGNINNESELLVRGDVWFRSAQLSGPGTLVLDGGTVTIVNDGFSDVDHQIRGNGLVDGSITNRQELYADGGIFAVEQRLTASPFSQTDVLLDGESFSLSGVITANEAILGGTLGVVVGESFSASVGDSFEIIDASSSVDGTFFSLDTSAAAGYEFQINYLADGVEIEVTDILPVLANIDGDFDQDGDVDADDIDFYSLNVDNEIARAENERLNLNLDGVVTLADHNVLVAQYAQTSNGEIGTFAGDFNLDGTVDVLGDAFILVSNLGIEGVQFGYADGDSNADGRVDVLNDAFALVENLGRSNTSGFVSLSISAVPEPNGLLVLLSVAAAGFARRKRG